MTGPAPPTWIVNPALAGARLVAPGVWRLRLPMSWPDVDHTNAYAIERDDGLMLVDCGTAGDATCIAALDVALAQAGHALGDVRALVATHAHSDHVGLAAHVVQSTGAEVWSHPASDRAFYDVLRHPARFTAAREARAQREGVPASRLAAFASVDEEVQGTLGPVTSDHPLVDGVRLPSAVGDWEVVETPGHTPSHVCLVQRARRLVLSGDLVCIAFSPWLDYGFSADPLADMLASFDRLEALGPMDYALPGHGRPLDDLGTVIAGHRRAFIERLDAVRDALADAPVGAYALATRLHGDAPDMTAVGHLSETLSHLSHLRRRGEAVREDAADGTYTYRAMSGDRR
jgi:glyoxylase-like metal-dependent hydrolase (beta-lactamase superfamily II)